MPQDFVVQPIGFVHSEIHDAVDDVWGGLRSLIQLDPSLFSAGCLAGLEEFSHVEILFVFDRVRDSEIHTGARHPRGRTDWPKVGIFAQRAKNRPNRIGVTICRLISVSSQDLSIVVEGLDAIDGTPVLDLKPYMREFGVRDPVRQPAWASELMAKYWESRD
ncbi:MAG TPA: SAM-dependent methyltransferase [Bryobacteraceae bacterium]|nr:SAM-dependent methyltransferase [Bryobacteraceae bacterium]